MHRCQNNPLLNIRTLNRKGKDQPNNKEVAQIVFKRRDFKNCSCGAQFNSLKVTHSYVLVIGTELLKVTRVEIENQAIESRYEPIGIYYRPSKPRQKGIARLPYGFKR